MSASGGYRDSWLGILLCTSKCAAYLLDSKLVVIEMWRRYRSSPSEQEAGSVAPCCLSLLRRKETFPVQVRGDRIPHDNASG